MALPLRKKTDRIGKGMMNWKKNAFSYLIWFVYAAVTGMMLLWQGTKACSMAGLDEYMGIVFAVVCAAVAGGIAFLLHRFAAGHADFFQEKRIHILVLGTVFAAALFAVGFFLRLQGMDGGQASSSVYYQMAKVAEGQGIPETVHGAVYFYVRLLRGVFLLLGNNAVIGLWVQIALQFGASLLLFLAMRKLVGMTAGLVALGFCMCTPYMVESSLVLSPQMLYFFLVMAALFYMTMRYGSGEETGNAHGLVVCFLEGILVALCSYVDILGIALLFAALGGILRFREQPPNAGRKAGAVLLCLAGLIQGLGSCLLLDAWLSGKPIHRVAGAWLSLYRPESFLVPDQVKALGFVPELGILSVIMTFGIFSFWFDRERERISAVLLSACAIMAASCFGLFTEEMPGFFFLYLAFVALAGIGFGQCLCAQPVERREMSGEVSEETSKEQTDLEILMEGKTEPESVQNGPRFLENPLPLPKKHVKRVLDYTLPAPCQDDDYDYPVSDDDDFDI